MHENLGGGGGVAHQKLKHGEESGSERDHICRPGLEIIVSAFHTFFGAWYLQIGLILRQITTPDGFAPPALGRLLLSSYYRCAIDIAWFNIRVLPKPPPLFYLLNVRHEYDPSVVGSFL